MYKQVHFLSLLFRIREQRKDVIAHTHHNSTANVAVCSNSSKKNILCVYFMHFRVAYSSSFGFSSCRKYKEVQLLHLTSLLVCLT